MTEVSGSQLYYVKQKNEITNHKSQDNDILIPIVEVVSNYYFYYYYFLFIYLFIIIIIIIIVIISPIIIIIISNLV